MSAEYFDRIRSDFRILQRTVHGKPLVYLDNAATTQKPRQVIEAMVGAYESLNANIHRGVHTLSQEATASFEAARETVQKHLNAEFAHEIIFTSGTTAAINLVAGSFGQRLKPGDEVIVTEMEHHSNFLPWQMLCQSVGAKLCVVPVTESGELNLEVFEKTLSDKTKIVSLTHVSNTLGTVNPIKDIIKTVRRFSKEIAVMIDGAQSVPHMRVDVRDLDADFYCFSGHKVYAPTGIGVLYGKSQILNEMPPYQVGGGAIKTVSIEETVYADLPMKFESGTPHIEGAIGLAAALDYVNAIGIDQIHDYENDLLNRATEKLSSIPGLKIIGSAQNKASVLSFVIDGLHPFDIGTLLDMQGIAVRTGHHCTQPLMARYGIPGTVRASFAFYNTVQEVDKLQDGILKAQKMLS